jgi:chromate transporter
MSGSATGHNSAWTIFIAFLRLGLTSFGGPIAHLGYFRSEFVSRRAWVDERSYADLVALCQFLPGPASSQVGMGIGFARGGMGGALAAWVGFTLPSALMMILIALGIEHWGQMPEGVVHGLKVVAVAVVAQAVWGMMRNLCPGRSHKLIMFGATAFLVALPSAWNQIIVILAGALLGRWAFSSQPPTSPASSFARIDSGIAVGLLVVFAILLIGLPVMAGALDSATLAMLDVFYRVGALVFGGGHVMLPLLQSEVVPPGWVSNDTFLAGYGAAQAMPGPLFTFAAFLGASASGPISGWAGGLLALVAIFVPSFLLILGALPFWDRLRGNVAARATLAGVNAAVVGLLLAALYDPVWTSAIRTPADFALATAALLALTRFKAPPWLVVALTAGGGAVLAV